MHCSILRTTVNVKIYFSKPKSLRLKLLKFWSNQILIALFYNNSHLSFKLIVTITKQLVFWIVFSYPHSEMQWWTSGAAKISQICPVLTLLISDKYCARSTPLTLPGSIRMRTGKYFFRSNLYNGCSNKRNLNLTKLQYNRFNYFQGCRKWFIIIEKLQCRCYKKFGKFGYWSRWFWWSRKMDSSSGDIFTKHDV